MGRRAEFLRGRTHGSLLAKPGSRDDAPRDLVYPTDGCHTARWIVDVDSKQIRQATQEKPRPSTAPAAELRSSRPRGELGWAGSLGRDLSAHSPCVQVLLHDAAPRTPEEIRAAPVGKRVAPCGRA
jgi:hypothetical protein